MEVIHSKTAKLFEAASRLGAVLAGLDTEAEEAMARYGMHLGTAFQLIDDVLDYSASSEAMGKNVGDDLAEGKPTLPLIHAMRQGTADQAAVVRAAIEEGGLERINEVLAAIESTGAIAYTSRVAREEAERAVEQLRVLPDSRFKSALGDLAEFSVDRTF
jgi:octaprenyl-diphosphate synthase